MGKLLKMKQLETANACGCAAVDDPEPTPVSCDPTSYITEKELSDYIQLTNDEKQAIEQMRPIFPLKVTHYYAELLRGSQPGDPLRKLIVPSLEELKKYDDDEKLAKNRVLPYYAGYGMITPGTRHFTVGRDHAKKIVGALENKTSGFCIPTILTLDESNNKTRKTD